jgi:serine/threonine-protein kinase
MSEPIAGQPTHPTGATADDDLLAELADDFLRRHRAGESPSPDEYCSKHPGLADRIRELFPAVIAMEQPGLGATADVAAPSERVGATVGRYKLLERIGEGGFGVVYMAEQQHPVRRKVALKVIKPGLDTRQVIARFEAERQALALMDHPNIATVLDAGATDSGRPYFVMELVHGVPVTEYCDRNQLSPRERLELFVQVCRAVQHAHTKGIIHRDLKPTNVLVTLHEGVAVPKVIDFGVAKATGQQLTEKTLFTNFAQMVGTPLYMSPEQAEMTGVDVDTRSDVYSLGVLLYELLTGTTPIDKERLKQAAFDEVRRIIREEEPPRPSTRLSTMGEQARTVSAHRRSDPKQLGRVVRGELDWIVMKALEKQRARRYETVNGLARDVERYLRNETVEACPPSVAYRVRKFARRNKGALAVAALVLFFLVLLGSGVGWAARDRAARQSRVAAQVDVILGEVDRLEREQKWAEALAAARRADAAVAAGGADAATAARVRELLKDREFLDRLEQIRMQRATWVDGEFDYAGTDRDYARAFRERGMDMDELPVETSVDRLTARGLPVMPLGAALDDWVAVRRAVAESDVARWKRLVTVARGVDPDPLRDRIRATWGQPTSQVQDELRRLADSVDVREQHPVTVVSLTRTLWRVRHADPALRLLRAGQSAHPGDFWLNFELASLLHQLKDREGAARFYTAAVSLRPQAAGTRSNLAVALSQQGKLDEAVAAYRKAIELDPKEARLYNNLGTTLSDQGKLDEAVAAYRKAIELDPKYAPAYDNLGNALDKQGKLDDAVAAHRQAVALDPTFAWAYSNLAAALWGQKKVDEAIAAYRKAIELDPTDGLPYKNLAAILRSQNKVGEALAVYRKLAALDPKSAASGFSSVGAALRDQKKLDEAIAAYGDAIALDPKSAQAHRDRGDLRRRTGRLQEAVADVARALELDPDTPWNWYTAAALYLHAGDVERYRGACRELLDRCDKQAAVTPADAERTAKTCALAPDSVSDFSRVERLAQRSVTGTERSEWYRNFVLAKALTDYRAGRLDEAAEWLGRFEPKANGTHWDATGFAALAMAQHRLGRAEQARASLASARAIIANNPTDAMSGGYWFDWLHCEILCREAEQVLAK